MARIVVVALALAGCGLASKDVDVTADLVAGGGAPTDGQASIDSGSLIAPFSADVSKLKSVTLKAARLDATDGGDLSFVASTTVSVNGTTIASGQTVLDVQPVELKPYLQSGAVVSVKVTYTSRPVQARTMRLTLTLHGDLL